MDGDESVNESGGESFNGSFEIDVSSIQNQEEETSNVNEIMKSNINLLQLIEPYYDWDEIIELLEEMKKQNCKLAKDKS